MKSVTLVMVAAEEVRARRRLAGDAVASVKFRPRTVRREFEASRGVSENVSEIGK